MARYPTKSRANFDRFSYVPIFPAFCNDFFPLLSLCHLLCCRQRFPPCSFHIITSIWAFYSESFQELYKALNVLQIITALAINKKCETSKHASWIGAWFWMCKPRPSMASLTYLLFGLYSKMKIMLIHHYKYYLALWKLACASVLILNNTFRNLQKYNGYIYV